MRLIGCETHAPRCSRETRRQTEPVRWKGSAGQLLHALVADADHRGRGFERVALTPASAETTDFGTTSGKLGSR